MDKIKNKTEAGFAQLLIVIVIFAIAGGLAFVLIKNPPRAEKKDNIERLPTLVETARFKKGQRAATVEAMGKVTASLQTELKPQLSGKVIALAQEFVPGGFVKKDQIILEIDPKDYELDVQSKKAALAQAQAAYDLEKGQQAIARDEMRILEQTTGKKLKNSDLALRKPQMAQAKADLAAAMAALDLSLVNLERTKVKAPFDGIITKRNINLGDFVSTQTSLMTLSGIEEYWIEISLPSEELRWLQLPHGEEKGSSALITDRHNNRKFEGNLFKIIGTLNEQSRLAEILVSLSGPLKENGKIELDKALLLNDFVHVTLRGHKISCTLIPRTALRAKQTIWINKDDTLEIRPVSIGFQTEEHVCLTDGINNNDDIVTSNITVPINGMKLTISNGETNRTSSPETLETP